jgi:hypothetical protein
MDGDTVVQVATNNPSFDDNVFFGAFEISAIGAIGESILLTPLAAVNPTGTSHTVTATVVNDDNDPVVGRSVDFQILSGPHAGTVGNDVTDGAGQAEFTYVGTLTGTDTIVACMTNSGGEEQCSNEVEKTWTETCFTFDFSTEDDQVTPLVNGQHIDTEFGTIFTLSSSGPNAGLGIFDSTPGGPNDPSQDRDLLVDTGNILILQTENYAPNGDDVFPRPNDDEDGGTITAAFALSVEPNSLRLIDLDTDGCTVTLTDSSGLQRTYVVPPGWTGDILTAGPGQGLLDLTTLAPQPGFASVATAAEDVGFDGLDVVQIDVQVSGSGAIDDLTVCAGGVPMARCEPRNGTGANPMRLTSDELPILGTSWHADLDCGGFPGGVARLEVRRLATQGVTIPMGELLVAGDLVYTTSAAHTGASAELGWSIPFDLSLMGVEVHAQGVCMGTLSRKIARATLSNALDLTLGF